MDVVPRTMLSSTRRTFLPRNSVVMAFSLRRMPVLRNFCVGIMNVRKTYRFLTKPSTSSLPRCCATERAATLAVSGMGITASISASVSL